MKQKIILILFAACCVFNTKAQLLITQNFDTPSTLTTAASGWTVVNNSSPLGSTSWFPGNRLIFPAYNGADSTYIAANYNNTSGSSGTISDWLITPTVTLDNGGVFQFATRTASAQTVSPDRLELYMSTGTGSNVGTTTSLGTFSTLLVSVNQNLTNTGYPTSWTVYTATLSGLTASVVGRFGFRYDVTSAGPTGTNSSYIGIDGVSYSLPCANPTLSISSSTPGICSGDLAVLTATGGTTYTWSGGQTTPSIAVSPTASAVYTLVASSIPNCNSSETVAVTVTLSPNLSVSNVTTCPGTAATLVASGANTYSWSTGATTNSIIVLPTADSSFALTGYNGNCQQSQLVTVTMGASLSVVAAASQATICAGQITTLTANGASTYTWNTTIATHSPANVETPTVTTKYTIMGLDSSGTCFGEDSITVSVLSLPVLTIMGTPALTGNNISICINAPLSLTVTGASTYSWSGTSNLTNVRSLTTPSVAGTDAIGVVGTGTNGCSATAIINAAVSVCTGIESIAAAAQLSVYPNPFGAELNVANFSGNIELYDALGQVVLKNEIVAGQSSVATDALSKGIYVLKAYDKTGKLVSTQKLIKN